MAAIEGQYWRLMEESFQLKEYGHLSLFEQAEMTAEDRKWWLKRVEKEIKDRHERERGQMPDLPRPDLSRSN